MALDVTLIVILFVNTWRNKTGQSRNIEFFAIDKIDFIGHRDGRRMVVERIFSKSWETIVPNRPSRKRDGQNKERAQTLVNQQV